MSTFINLQANQDHLGLDAEARTYISRQVTLFESMLPQLLQKYSDRWIWFENSHVIDADFNYQDLIERVRQKVGNKIVLIKKVESIITHS
jgi:hypothetical protein